MALHTVGVILLGPVAVFEFGVAVEVFGSVRSDEGLEPFDFRVCGIRPGAPIAANRETTWRPTVPVATTGRSC